ncbi:MAG: NAD(P)H-dependent oxidoreductase [Pseudomonadota bacterium]|nr:NAD(P)H-dependent oxidoreductase [Pseudomonadota bacterium]
MNPKIAIIPGSNRSASLNRLVANETMRILARTDASVAFLDLTDYPLPIYDGDEESGQGIPENASLLARQLMRQDALLLISPEYNRSIPPLLKNTIDWVSRVRKIDGRPVQPFKGLVVGLASASPGRFGGSNGLEALRLVMRALGSEVLTTQCSVANASDAFDAKGALIDDHARLSLEALCESLVDVSRSLSRTAYTD